MQEKNDYIVQKRKEIALLKRKLELMKTDLHNPDLDIPYVPSTEEKVSIMIALADVKPGQNAADLGCGDGRVLIALAKAGANVCGFETAPSRVLLSKENVEQEKLSGQISIHQMSFFDANLRGFDIVTVYGITSIMERLEKKLQDELKPGARIVSNRFTFPNWQHVREDNDVYLYIKE